MWVVNQDNDSVSVFDAVTNAKLAEIAVGLMPRSIALAPNGNVWVTNKGAATISVISPSTLAVAQTVVLPYASQPFGVAFAPTGGSAFVALEATGRLLKLDANSGAQTGALDVGPNVRGVAVSADGTSVFVSRFVTPRLPGEETASINTSGVGRRSGCGECQRYDALPAQWCCSTATSPTPRTRAAAFPTMWARLPFHPMASRRGRHPNKTM